MLAQSGTQAIIVSVDTPGTPTAGVTEFEVPESGSFGVQLLLLNRETPDARVHNVSIRSRKGTPLAASGSIEERYTAWTLDTGTQVQAATRTSGLVFTMPFGEDDADITYYGRVIYVEGTMAAGELGDTGTPEFSVVSDEPSLPGLPVNTTVDEIPAFVDITTWRGETDFIVGGVKYLVVGLAIFD